MMETWTEQCEKKTGIEAPTSASRRAKRLREGGRI